MTETRKQTPEQESSKKESPYNKKELKWLKEQEAEYYRLKKIWDIPEDQEETEEIKEAKRKSLEILKAAKKLKMEREPDEYSPKANKYEKSLRGATVLKAIDVNGKPYALLQKSGVVFLTGFEGEEFVPGSSNHISGPVEYNGEAVLMVSEGSGKNKINKLKNLSGRTIESYLPGEYKQIFTVGDKMLYSSGSSLHEVVGGPQKVAFPVFEGEIDDNIKEVVDLGRDSECDKSSVTNLDLAIIIKDNQGYILVDENGKPLASSYFGEMRSPAVFKDKIIILSKDDKGWSIFNKEGEDFFKSRAHDAHSLVSFGDTMVFAGEITPGRWMVLDETFSSYTVRSFDKIFEIGKVTESMGYVLGQKDDKLIKSTFKIEKNE